ncbi:carboxypeptidase M32 [uncultured Enorma sp.]|uniref:carboxypeptidase M32 n=1 Tax=uncultured Enorma sp. TaxID=1714346 RepID=UPI0026024A0B|nr:carboxypeptidase M32 [uncultured Enorma sp.]
MPATPEAVAQFRQLERELWTRTYLMGILEFDGETVAPPKGAPARAEAMGALAGEYHEILTSSRAQEIIAQLKEAGAAGELDEQATMELRTLGREQQEAMAIPTEEAAAFSKLTSEANAVWHKAKLANDWASFEPYVDRIVETLKRHAAYMYPDRDAYDVWLDQYERGMDSASYDAFFDQVRKTVVPLVHEIAQRPQPEASFLSAHVPEATQLAIASDLMGIVGLDPEATVLSCVEHPFTNGMAAGDVRITTHIYENNLISNVYSIIHEAGHAIYEQNIDPAYAYTCLGTGSTMGIHESQSRFFENIVGRSRAFMTPLLEVLRRHAPEVYGNVTEDELYRAVNIATPSLIRTEADELTYPLHIMVRYDIERQLFAGDATARDIPTLWQKYMHEYLDIDVPNDTLGCLQDTHWSNGSFGYFPSYALGSAYGAQMVPSMKAAGVDLAGACGSGELAPVCDWLREKIWRWGAGKDGIELLQEACGAPFDAAFYCDYLERKFGELYNVK